MNNKLIPLDSIRDRIYIIRGQKVMLDSDLARLYRVSTKMLNQATKRNSDRFPQDFMFQLNKDEVEGLICQFGTSNLKSQFVTSSWGGVRKPPYAFTEQGIAMLSSVLRSKRAVQVNIAIMRAFVRLRQILATHKELARKLEQLERKVGVLDADVKEIFDAINKLISPPPEKPKKIGFIK